MHNVDNSTSLDELHGLLGEFDEGSFTGNKFVKEVKGITEDSDGVFVSVLLSKESFVLKVSDVGELSKGGLGIDLIFLVNSKIDFGSGKRG